MTTITFLSGIPNAPNNPSTDQPNMKTNNDNIPLYVAVDHVGFNTLGSGQHNQVTFHANNVPSVPTSPPILFTNNDSFSLPQLFYYSGDAAHSSTQYVASSNGSTFLFGGMIAKWGNVTATDNTTIPFPVVFPNNCYNVQITVNAISVLPKLVTVSGTPLPGGFTPRVRDTNGIVAAPVAIFYLAIGN